MLNHADVIGDQSDAVTQNAWFLCTLCAAISGEISILIQTGAESWGRFPVHVLVGLYWAIIITVVGTVANGLVAVVMRYKVFVNLPLAVYFTAMAVSETLVLITTNLQHILWHATTLIVRYFGQTSLCTTVGKYNTWFRFTTTKSS